MIHPLLYTGFFPWYNTGLPETSSLTSGMIEQVQEPGGDDETYACEDVGNIQKTLGNNRKSMERSQKLDSHSQELGCTSQNSSNPSQLAHKVKYQSVKSQIVTIPAMPLSSKATIADKAKKPPEQNHTLRTTGQSKKHLSPKESHVQKEEQTKKQSRQTYVRSSKEVDLTQLCGHLFCTSYAIFNSNMIRDFLPSSSSILDRYVYCSQKGRQSKKGSSS